MARSDTMLPSGREPKAARPAAGTTASRRLAARIDEYFGILSIAPTVVIMIGVFGAPLALSLYLSFVGWSPSQPLFAGRFIGLENYTDLLTDPAFLRSVLLTLGYTAAVVAAELALGLAIALLLNLDLRLIGLFRALLIVPMMMTPIVAALCWKLLLDPARGLINQAIGQNIVWLGQPGTALLSVGLVNVWQNAPYVAVLILAGLRSLSREPFEAARIDGANRLQVFWYVTLPMLRPFILVALLLRTIFEFRSFDNVYVLTGGGPANGTMVLSIFTYMTSFVQFDLSLGSASSWIMLGLSLAMCALFIAASPRREP